MKLKTKHRINTQFSLSSMTDIIFLLLIFFMLSASFVTPTSLPIDLPASQTTQTTTPHVYLSITAGLNYYIGNQPIQVDELHPALQEKLPAHNGSILLQVDQSVPISYVIQVIDIAGSLHADVSVATRPDQP